MRNYRIVWTNIDQEYTPSNLGYSDCKICGKAIQHGLRFIIPADAKLGGL